MIASWWWFKTKDLILTAPSHNASQEPGQESAKQLQYLPTHSVEQSGKTQAKLTW